MRIFMLLIALFSMSSVQAQNKPITPHNVDQVVEFAMIGRGYVHSIAYSPDGLSFAVSSSVGIWIYDTADWMAEPRLLPTPISTLGEIVFTPNGQRIIGRVNYIPQYQLWDVATGEERLEKLGISGNFQDTQFTHDGAYFTTRTNQEITLWDTQTEAIISTLPISSSSLNTIEISTDQQWIALRDNNSLTAWHREANIPIELPLFVGSFRFTANQEVVGLFNNQLVKWDLSTGETTLAPFIGERIFEIVFSPDKSKVMLYTPDAIQIWDIQQMQYLSTLDGTNDLHAYWTHRLIQFSPDGSHIISNKSMADQAEALLVWDVTTGKQRLTLPTQDRILHFIYSPDGTQLVSTTRYDVRFWSAETGARSYEITDFKENRIASALYSPDDRLLAIGRLPNTSFGTASRVELFDAQTNEYLYAITPTDPNAQIIDIEFTADSQQLIITFSGQPAEVWDIATQKLIRLVGNSDFSTAIILSDGSEVLQIIPWKAYSSWDVTTGELLATHETDRYDEYGSGITNYTTRSPYYHHHADHLFVFYTDHWDGRGVARGWNMRTKAFDLSLILDLLGEGNDYLFPHLRYTLSADQAYIAYSADLTIRIYEQETDEGIIFELPPPDQGNIEFQNLYFNPSGQLLVGTTNYYQETLMYSTIHFWDVATGEELHRLAGHTISVAALVFNTAGDRILTTSNDGTIRIWGIP